MRLIDRTGQRFGRLLVLRKHERPKMWLCVCDCGAEHLATGSALASGNTRSCGCLFKEWSSFMGSHPEFVRKRADATVRHGHKRRGARTVEYATWLAMKRRCYDRKSKDYPSWGGRGIRVCDRWLNSFENFLADMGPRPAGSYSIDRLRSEEGYSPGNCRWATPQQQGETKRNNRRVSFRGVEYTSLKAACESLGLRYGTIFERVKRGMSIGDALAIGSERPPNIRPRESYLRKDRRHANAPPARS